MDYQPGDDILILADNPTTLQDRGIGPFHIEDAGNANMVHMIPLSYNTDDWRTLYCYRHWRFSCMKIQFGQNIYNIL